MPEQLELPPSVTQDYALREHADDPVVARTADDLVIAETRATHSHNPYHDVANESESETPTVIDDIANDLRPERDEQGVFITGPADGIEYDSPAASPDTMPDTTPDLVPEKDPVDFREMDVIGLMRMGYSVGMSMLIKDLAGKHGVSNRQELRAYFDDADSRHPNWDNLPIFQAAAARNGNTMPDNQPQVQSKKRLQKVREAVAQGTQKVRTLGGTATGKVVQPVQQRYEDRRRAYIDNMDDLRPDLNDEGVFVAGRARADREDSVTPSVVVRDLAKEKTKKVSTPAIKLGRKAVAFSTENALRVSMRRRRSGRGKHVGEPDEELDDTDDDD